MTKQEIEYMVEKEKIMSMRELKVVQKREKIQMSTDQIVRVIVQEEIGRIGKDIVQKKEINEFLKNFSSSTAYRQLNELRSGRAVWGPVPSSLEKNIKIYYPVQEVAAVMYMQGHPVDKYGKPSLRRILETRHD